MAASAIRKFSLTLFTSKVPFSSKVIASFQCQKRAFSFSKCLADRLYTDKHEWIVIENGKGTIGISNYAQEQLGEIVYVETPAVGTTLNPQDVSGCLESVKAASEVYSPVGGTVTEVNSKLASEPALVNSSPLLEGWLYKLDVAPGTNTKELMNEEAYKAFLETIVH
ncbi:glycine cleavage system H protein mitochondrial [Biomphalaria pfeifferi]|uniref:Glycine cleavage system H protein n=1 Tax=Biomphalaria pfeifferi TaxID=112525 RepID=A0AAD8AUZ6_BIOPF|nr:glycine cleavage system H protein mitochondrial [Biomphalaria pfeifferi]